MVRALYTIGVLALVGAGIVIGFCMLRWLEPDSGPETAQSPSTVQGLRDALAARGKRVSQKTSPLIREAQDLATYLNPLPAPEPVTPKHKSDTGGRPTPTPAISPPTPSPNFRLQGTVYCTSRPETSMALIFMGAGQIGEQRWVREGSVVGHFIVQEIRPSVVICRRQNSEQTCEISVEAGPPRPSVVRRHIPELARAGSAALDVTSSDVNAVSDGTPQSFLGGQPR
jgi:hypothetical protein